MDRIPRPVPTLVVVQHGRIDLPEPAAETAGGRASGRGDEDEAHAAVDGKNPATVLEPHQTIDRAL